MCKRMFMNKSWIKGMNSHSLNWKTNNKKKTEKVYHKPSKKSIHTSRSFIYRILSVASPPRTDAASVKTSATADNKSNASEKYYPV